MSPYVIPLPLLFSFGLPYRVMTMMGTSANCVGVLEDVLNGLASVCIYSN